jgi:hypothetical protein
MLEQVVSGEIDVYVGYRRLYEQWCTNSAAVPELRPMFRIPGLSRDGLRSITEAFKSQVVSKAREILPHFSD